MEKSNQYFKTKLVGIFILGFSLFTLSFFIIEVKTLIAQGTSNNDPAIAELQNKILQKNADINKINTEIKKYQIELQGVSKEADTLSSAVKSLDITQSKLLKDIELTGNKIDSTNLNLSKLDIEIKKSEERISLNGNSLAETLRLLNEAGENSVIEIMLKYDDLSSFWNEIDSIEKFQVGVKQNLQSLKLAKQVLEEKLEEDEEKKAELEFLKLDISSQKNIVDANKNQKEILLKKTKNTESEYQKILEENLKKKAELEKELFLFESELQIKIDPTKLPGAKSGVLDWPLDNITVTQYFGKTVDSKKLYVSGTHNGIDFRASVGTKVKSAEAGVISHIGNTDNASGCLSFGKWILVKHNNGLSTLYSHLSSIQVNVGQVVAKGEGIAWSGGMPGASGSGYSTGPHLHFGVYATEGLRPQNYQSGTPCNGAYMPLADLKAYLDPMSYLPAL